jgi:hypothetical protein
MGGFALAAVLAGLAALPIYLPYRRVAIEQGMRRTLDGVAEFSATLDGYLASYSRLHDWAWNAAAPRSSPDAYFPGILVTLLAIVAVVWRLRPSAGGSGADLRVDGRRRTIHGSVIVALVALAVIGCLLSLGTRTPVYGWLYAVFPPMSGLRAAARFGVLFLLATALLAGCGLARIRGRLAGRAAIVTGVAALAVVTLEALRAPMAYTRFEGIPGIYRLLAAEPDPVVLVEVPFYPPEAIFQNAEYVLNSTAHWRPLMNGYSGYTPATYRDVAWPFWNFPAAWSIDAMRAAGVTHLVVHPARFDHAGREVLRQALASPHLERVAVSRGGVTLFRVR